MRARPRDIDASSMTSVTENRTQASTPSDGPPVSITFSYFGVCVPLRLLPPFSSFSFSSQKMPPLLSYLGLARSLLVRHSRTTSSLLVLGSAFSRSASVSCFAFVSPAPRTFSPAKGRSVVHFFSTMAKASNEVTHVDQDTLPDWMLPERTRILTADAIEPKKSGKSVVYWMQRDMRTVDNWALLYAESLAKESNLPLEVCYVMQPPPPSEGEEDGLPPKEFLMTERHGSFLLGGLEKVHEELQKVNVPFHIIKPSSDDVVGEAVCEEIADKIRPSIVVSDFSPLRQFRKWMEEQAVPLLEERNVPLHQVDAHNVVPVWTATDKRQVGARTLRPRIHKVLSTFLQDYPEFKGNSHIKKELIKDSTFDKTDLTFYLKLDESVPSVKWAPPGTDAAMARFQQFCKGGLKHFDTQRNDPTRSDICSSLSPWLNYGHISFQRLVMDVKALNKYANGTAAFVEEGLIRRELSDNFVFWEMDTYDSLESAAQWAQDSLELHSSDKREYVYTLEELENGMTHDDLWNAAELQVLRTGKMHGFLRMYWAKKILEWTESPNVALRTAQYLNDKYALDGNDPNGYVGVGWSIMGIHDMGWKERDVFGKIRFMNYAGCKRKFNVAQFVQMYDGAAENAIAAAQKHGKEAVVAKKMATAKKKAKVTSAGKTKSAAKVPAAKKKRVVKKPVNAKKPVGANKLEPKKPVAKRVEPKKPAAKKRKTLS